MPEDDISFLSSSIYRERVLRARSQSIEQKLLAGIELSFYATSITRAGIQHQHPTWTEDQIRAELRRRIELGKRLDYHFGCRHPYP